MPVVALDGKIRQLSCLPLKRLPMWLAQINVGKVPEELRERLMMYQLDAADALSEYFNPSRPAMTNARAFLKIASELVVHEDQLVDHSGHLA